jgi:hypothetical protein
MLVARRGSTSADSSSRSRSAVAGQLLCCCSDVAWRCASLRTPSTSVLPLPSFPCLYSFPFSGYSSKPITLPLKFIIIRARTNREGEKEKDKYRDRVRDRETKTPMPRRDADPKMLRSADPSPHRSCFPPPFSGRVPPSRLSQRDPLTHYKRTLRERRRGALATRLGRLSCRAHPGQEAQLLARPLPFRTATPRKQQGV